MWVWVCKYGRVSMGVCVSAHPLKHIPADTLHQLQHTVTRSNILQHTAFHRTKTQNMQLVSHIHTHTHTQNSKGNSVMPIFPPHYTATHCNILQRTAFHQTKTQEMQLVAHTRTHTHNLYGDSFFPSFFLYFFSITNQKKAEETALCGGTLSDTDTAHATVFPMWRFEVSFS